MYTISQAARYLHVSAPTLRRWDAKGFLRPLRTFGKNRRYTQEQLDLYLGVCHDDYDLLDRKSQEFFFGRKATPRA